MNQYRLSQIFVCAQKYSENTIKPLDQGEVDPCRDEIGPGFGSECTLADTSDLEGTSVLLLHSEESQIFL